MADISALLQYHFYEKIYFKVHESSYPSESKERLRNRVGVAEHVGDSMTYKILTADTQKLIYTSEIRTAEDPSCENKRADEQGKGEGTSKSKPPFIMDRRDRWRLSQGELPTPNHLPSLNPDDLIGRTFLAPPEQDGQQFRARIQRKIIDGDVEDPSYENVKFILKIDGDRADEIVGYNEVVVHMNRQLAEEFDEDQGSQKLWKFRRVVAHQGPLKPCDPRYKGSR
jgi:hypothetical protein